MAVRYVKDFEFPAAAGYTKSAPSKVTGQMYAKGGDVKAPKGKGMMIMIGIGTPKKGPMKKADGGSANAPGSNIPMDPDYMKRLGKSPGQGTPKRAAPKKPAPSTVPGSDIPTDDDYMKRLEDSSKYAKGGNVKKRYAEGSDEEDFKRPMSAAEARNYLYGKPMTDAERKAAMIAAKNKALGSATTSSEAKDSYMFAKGGKAKMQDKIGKVMHEFKAGELHSGSKKGAMVKNAKQALAIAMSEGKKAMKKNHGGMAHEDAAEDKALIKKMIKPAALKAKGGAAMGQAVQMAKTNAIEKSLKGQKKTAFADGGMAGMAGAPRVPSPLQRMAMMQRAKSVPVAPAGPMIAPGMSPDSRVGVGQMRPGSKPDIGAIRAAMARAATRANPDMAPSAMKKGGKVKMDNC